MTLPGPLLFGSFALAHLLVALGALLVVDKAPVIALSLFLVEIVTAYDNLIIVLGKKIGIGAAAERLNRMRFFLHAVVIGLLVPVYAGFGSLAGVGILGTTVATSAALFAAAVIAVFGYLVQYRAVTRIFPINCYGCLRYAQSVDERRRWPGYEYSEAELGQKAFPPLASIITVMIGLVLSLWTGLATAFWVPFAATLLMFTAAAFPAKTWGPLLTSCLEVVYSAGLLYSLWVLTGSVI